MSYLLDTNVISEWMKPQPNRRFFLILPVDAKRSCELPQDLNPALNCKSWHAFARCGLSHYSGNEFPCMMATARI